MPYEITADHSVFKPSMRLFVKERSMRLSSGFEKIGPDSQPHPGGDRPGWCDFDGLPCQAPEKSLRHLKSDAVLGAREELSAIHPYSGSAYPP